MMILSVSRKQLLCNHYFRGNGRLFGSGG